MLIVFKFTLIESVLDFVYCSRFSFEHLITEFVQNSKLHRYGWAVDRPLCEDTVDSTNYSLHSVVITVTTI